MSQVQFNSQLTDQISVSDEAAKQLLALTENEEGVNGIRIFVSGGGCGGMSYGMTFVEQPTPFDTTLEKGNLKVHVDLEIERRIESLVEMGELSRDEGRHWLEKMLSLSPQTPDSSLPSEEDLEQLLVNKGNKDDAKKVLEKSKELAMKNPEEYEDMKSSYDDLEAKIK